MSAQDARLLADTKVQFKRAGGTVAIRPGLSKRFSVNLRPKEFVMNATLKHLGALSGVAALTFSIVVAAGTVETSQDKYSAKVQGGLAFSNSRGTKAGRPSPSARTDRRSPSSSRIRP
jgi:hypothetical protein